LVSGCSRGPSEEELKYAQLQEQLTTLKQQYQELQGARTDLAAAETTLAEIEAVAERSRTDEQKAQLEELPAQIEGLNATKDAAFDAVQGTVADFLNVALNDFPEDPITAEGLQVYSDEAIVVANETVVQAGDYKKALNQLDVALSYYDSLGLAPYQPLVDRIAELDDLRFITQERFDLVQKNMTMDEVKEVAGVPYYQNIQQDEKRGVETWLYRKREGGAAAIYFRMKSGKVYNKNFDAVKTKVVE
jgi:hypothetical protein